MTCTMYHLRLDHLRLYDLRFSFYGLAVYPFGFVVLPFIVWWFTLYGVDEAVWGLVWVETVSLQ